jgi:hypothetical protein
LRGEAHRKRGTYPLLTGDRGQTFKERSFTVKHFGSFEAENNSKRSVDGPFSRFRKHGAPRCFGLLTNSGRGREWREFPPKRGQEGGFGGQIGAIGRGKESRQVFTGLS